MSDQTRDDIRSLLKSFGIQADEAVMAYLDDAPGDQPLQLRIVLEDVTAYDDDVPEERLSVAVEGQVRR